jgi:hypothetical protein
MGKDDMIKISEMIATLEKAMKEHGDLMVTTWDDENSHENPLSSISVQKREGYAVGSTLMLVADPVEEWDDEERKNTVTIVYCGEVSW